MKCDVTCIALYGMKRKAEREVSSDMRCEVKPEVNCEVKWEVKSKVKREVKVK